MSPPSVVKGTVDGEATCADTIVLFSVLFGMAAGDLWCCSVKRGRGVITVLVLYI